MLSVWSFSAHTFSVRSLFMDMLALNWRWVMVRVISGYSEPYFNHFSTKTLQKCNVGVAFTSSMIAVVLLQMCFVIWWGGEAVMKGADVKKQENEVNPMLISMQCFLLSPDYGWLRVDSDVKYVYSWACQTALTFLYFLRHPARVVFISL